MSFRQFGGLQFASKHNAVASNYNTSNNLLVTQNVGQSNSYINFLSDISGNINIYGNLDVSGDVDISGNLDVIGDVDVSGNLTSNYMFLSSGTNYTTANNGVVPKSYVDSVAVGLTPLPFCVLCSNAGPITLSGYQTIDGITLNNTFDGSAVLVNAQGGVNVPNVNNGVYIISSGAWSRASYLNTGAKATGTLTFILQGITYSNYRFVCTTGSNLSPALIGTNNIIWSAFDIPFSLGQGLKKTIINNNNTVISVDSSLNFINYLDNTAGPNPGILNIGTNTNTINIGSSASQTYVLVPDSTFNALEGQTGFQIATGKSSGDNYLYFGASKNQNYSFIQSVREGIGSRPLLLNARGGNVGIGTSTPNFRLDVNGDVNISSYGYSQTPATGTNDTTLATTAFVNTAINGSIPIGGIIMWSGASSPTNWGLCNGATYGSITTPDLRDRFIVGSGSSYAIGQTGGASTVTLQTTEIPAHTHDITYKTFQGASHQASDTNQNQASCYKAEEITPTITSTSTGGSGAHENRPPYYALAYIMRIS
jgi:microcystin-dependent protein